MSTSQEEPPPIDRRVAQLQAEFKAEAKALNKLATKLGPLARAKAFEDLAKLPALIQKVEKSVEALPLVASRGMQALSLVREEVAARKEEMRQSLSRDLRAACQEQQLSLQVLSTEEPIEIRIAPFRVLIDRDKGRAQITYAKRPILSCEATAAAILIAREKALKTLSQGFDPARFFEACYRAWKAALGAGNAGAGDRVEILEFLPYLAIQQQSRSFHVDPSERNYKGYTRARFAFDLDRLRDAGQLTVEGRRLNLGVATGTTASKKDRAVWLEDEKGNGEYKLTIFFTNAGGL